MKRAQKKNLFLSSNKCSLSERVHSSHLHFSRWLIALCVPCSTIKPCPIFYLSTVTMVARNAWYSQSPCSNVGGGALCAVASLGSVPPRRGFQNREYLDFLRSSTNRNWRSAQNDEASPAFKLTSKSWLSGDSADGNGASSLRRENLFHAVLVYGVLNAMRQRNTSCRLQVLLSESKIRNFRYFDYWP
jgi:hypothetical protein